MPFFETLQKPSVKFTLFLMLIAYLFSFAIRLIWVWHFKDTPEFYWNGQIMINTNDGYDFASGVQNALWGQHGHNPLIPTYIHYGIVAITSFLVKFTPFSLETITLYMPAVFSGLIVVPVILIGRLYGHTILGFLAALLASITWSYYNRTMIGYYDTDMFALVFPFFILYFLIKASLTFDKRSMLFGTILLSFYPYMYGSAKPIIAALVLFFTVYQLFFAYRDKRTYELLIILYLGVLPLIIVPSPYSYVFDATLAVMGYALLNRFHWTHRQLIVVSLILITLYLGLGDIAERILAKIHKYTFRGTEQVGLHFYDVFQTIREAGIIHFETFAKRIAGSEIGLVLSVIGYVLLVVRHRSMILALPLVGIGLFTYWGGLRFTVYAVPVAALGSVYLFWEIGEFFRNRQAQYVFTALATLGMLYPNIQHVIDYRVPTVFNKSEVTDLAKLNKIADAKDYTLTWWDYGYPMWFYSDTNTLIDGSKHHADNYIISQILQTDSPALAARLARLSVETYARRNAAYKRYNLTKTIDANASGYAMIDPDSKHQYIPGIKSAIIDTLLHNKQLDQKDPNLFLDRLKEGLIPLPKKTRDVYLYLPYRMMGIFPTVMVFGNIDLTTGNALRKPIFYPTSARGERNGQILFANGMLFDLRKGVLHIGNHEEKVAKFVVTQNAKGNHIKVEDQRYHLDGNLIVVYLKSYGRFVIMDRQTFQSMYVQMFMLGRYDKRYFEPVVVSPYSRIYRLKI